MFEVKLIEGYGPYRIDEQGIPLLNEVIWDFLERRHVSAEEFGKQFGKLTRKNRRPYTKSRIYQMLRDNSFPDEKTRRWVLAKLLQIPPVLLGIQTVDELLPLEDGSHSTRSAPVQEALPRPEKFDSSEYRQALKTYWQHNKQQTLSPFLIEVDARISRLEEEFLYGGKIDRKQVAELLCNYHILRANNARDRQVYEAAIDHYNRAYMFAKNNRLERLQAGILSRRGDVFREQGEALASEHNLAAADRNFAFAMSDFTRALMFDKKISPTIEGSISMALGILQADIAKTPVELHQAIKKIEKIEPVVGKASESYIEVDEERYHLSRAAAYLASPPLVACYPRDARRELRNALAAAPTRQHKRRQGYNIILEAKSYIIEGQSQLIKKRSMYADDCFRMAIEKASEALVIIKSIDSRINIARIEKLCSDLRATPFGENNIDLARLEVEIVQAKYPQVFQ